MPLTKQFKETVRKRAQADPAFRVELIREALSCMIEGDLDTGKGVLRDYINATVGFDVLAQHLQKQQSSVMRMLGPKGNPTAENLFGIIGFLKQQEGVTFELRVS